MLRIREKPKHTFSQLFPSGLLQDWPSHPRSLVSTISEDGCLQVGGQLLDQEGVGGAPLWPDETAWLIFCPTWLLSLAICAVELACAAGVVISCSMVVSQ